MKDEDSGARWRQVKAVLASAMDQRPSQRLDWVKRICRRNPDLLEEVVSLLALHDSSFLGRPVVEDLKGRDQAPAPSAGRRASAPEDLAGTRIGPFRIHERIGQGGFGVVHRAEDELRGEVLALKFLAPEYTRHPAYRTRFTREATAAAALRHPNIVRVQGAQEIGGHYLIVMELVSGTSLRERLQTDQPLPLAAALDLARQLARGLTEAHRKGVVHRDLKPANIMVTPNGRLKILDFGLAKMIEPDGTTGVPVLEPMRQLTRTGELLGSAPYLAPEQASGEAVDRRTDIFAFGSVLHELVSGKRAFERNGVIETVAAVVNEDPEPLGRLAAIPTALEELVARALEKDPERRWPSMKAVADRLELIGSGMPSGSPSPDS